MCPTRWWEEEGEEKREKRRSGGLREKTEVRKRERREGESRRTLTKAERGRVGTGGHGGPAEEGQSESRKEKGQRRQEMRMLTIRRGPRAADGEDARGPGCGAESGGHCSSIQRLLLTLRADRMGQAGKGEGSRADQVRPSKCNRRREQGEGEKPTRGGIRTPEWAPAMPGLHTHPRGLWVAPVRICTSQPQFPRL